MHNLILLIHAFHALLKLSCFAIATPNLTTIVWKKCPMDDQINISNDEKLKGNNHISKECLLVPAPEFYPSEKGKPHLKLLFRRFKRVKKVKEMGMNYSPPLQIIFLPECPTFISKHVNKSLNKLASNLPFNQDFYIYIPDYRGTGYSNKFQTPYTGKRLNSKSLNFTNAAKDVNRLISIINISHPSSKIMIIGQGMGTIWARKTLFFTSKPNLIDKIVLIDLMDHKLLLQKGLEYSILKSFKRKKESPTIFSSLLEGVEPPLKSHFDRISNSNLNQCSKILHDKIIENQIKERKEKEIQEIIDKEKGNEKGKHNKEPDRLGYYNFPEAIIPIIYNIDGLNCPNPKEFKGNIDRFFKELKPLDSPRNFKFTMKKFPLDTYVNSCEAFKYYKENCDEFAKEKREEMLGCALISKMIDFTIKPGNICYPLDNDEGESDWRIIDPIRFPKLEIFIIISNRSIGYRHMANQFRMANIKGNKILSNSTTTTSNSTISASQIFHPIFVNSVIFNPLINGPCSGNIVNFLAFSTVENKTKLNKCINEKDKAEYLSIINKYSYLIPKDNEKSTVKIVNVKNDGIKVKGEKISSISSQSNVSIPPLKKTLLPEIIVEKTKKKENNEKEIIKTIKTVERIVAPIKEKIPSSIHSNFIKELISSRNEFDIKLIPSLRDIKILWKKELKSIQMIGNDLEERKQIDKFIDIAQRSRKSNQKVKSIRQVMLPILFNIVLNFPNNQINNTENFKNLKQIANILEPLIK